MIGVDVETVGCVVVSALGTEALEREPKSAVLCVEVGVVSAHKGEEC